MASVLLLLPPILLRENNRPMGSEPVESDVFVHLRDALLAFGADVIQPTWRLDEAGRLSLDKSEIEKLLAEKAVDFILVEASAPYEQTYLYPLDMISVAKKKRVAALIPDFWFRDQMIETLRSYEPFSAQFLIFGNSDLIEPILKYGGVTSLKGRIRDIGGFPVPKRLPVEKPVDFCYIGSSKKFRVNLLKSIVANGHMKTVICTAGRFGHIGTTGLETTAGYMSLLNSTKTSLWTRASEPCVINNKVYLGGYTSRFHECLATSTFLFYWGEQPRFSLLSGRFLSKPDEPPVAGLTDGVHYIRVKNAIDLRKKARAITSQEKTIAQLRSNIDRLHDERFSSNIIIRNLISFSLM